MNLADEHQQALKRVLTNQRLNLENGRTGPTNEQSCVVEALAEKQTVVVEALADERTKVETQADEQTVVVERKRGGEDREREIGGKRGGDLKIRAFL